jgi:hypothetical protein
MSQRYSLISAFSMGLIAAALAASTAQAQTQAPTLEQACPGASAALQDALGDIAAREDTETSVFAGVAIEEGKLTVSSLSGGNQDQRRAVRRALGDLDCGSSGNGRQAMNLHVALKPAP